MGGARTRAGLVCLATWALGGCSWIFMAPPPKAVPPPGTPVECTESDLAPTLDTVGAVFVGTSAVVGAVALWATCEGGSLEGPSKCPEGWVAVGVGALVGGLYVLSAKQGNTNVRRCLAVHCSSGVEAACRKLPPQKELPQAPEPPPGDVPPPPQPLEPPAGESVQPDPPDSWLEERPGAGPLNCETGYPGSRNRMAASVVRAALSSYPCLSSPCWS